MSERDYSAERRRITESVFGRSIVDADSTQYNPEKPEMHLSIVSCGRSEKGRNRVGPNQDAFGFDSINGVLVVCDGVGGLPFGEIAAKTALNSYYGSFKNAHPHSENEFYGYLLDAQRQARDEVMKYGKGGSTVATAVKIAEIEGKFYAGFVHTGDTKLYLVDKEADRYVQLTQDQSRGNMVFNSLTNPSGKLDQIGLKQLDYRHRLVLITDGIGLDKKLNQPLPPSQLLSAFLESSPQGCVNSLIEYSVNNSDDKSCIVADIVPNYHTR